MIERSSSGRISAADLRIGGFAPFSTVDRPGHLAAVIFCQGCPWRCVYCHNPGLQRWDPDSSLNWADVRAHLEKRAGLLDTVVFSGGEPLAQAALAHAIGEVRSLGFRVGLHTAGVLPARFTRILPAIDWVGLDIKALPGDYARITGIFGSDALAWASLDRVLASDVDHEVRITYSPDLCSQDELCDLCHILAEKGVKQLALQVARPGGQGWSTTARHPAIPESLLGELGLLFERLTVR